MNPEQEFEALRGRRDRAFRALETALTKNVLDWGFASKALLPPQEHTSDGATFLRAALKREAWGPSNGDSLRGVFVAWNLKKPARLIEEFLAQHPPEKYKAAEEAYLAWHEIKVELEREEKRRPPPTRSWIGSGGETIPDETHMAAYLLKQLVPIPTPPAGWTIGIMCDGEACTKAPTRWLPSNKQGAAVRAACASLRCATTAAATIQSDLCRNARLPCGVKGCRNSHVYEFKCAADGCAKVVRSCCTGHTGEALSAHLPHPPPEKRCSVESCFERSTRSEPCASCGEEKRKCEAHGYTQSSHRCADVPAEKRCGWYHSDQCRRPWEAHVACALGCGSSERACGVHNYVVAPHKGPWPAHQSVCPEAALAIKRKELQRIEALAEKSVGDGRWLCVVCQDAARSYAAMPCSHLFGCGPCSQKLAKCPICRKAIESFIPVYLS